LGPAYQAIFQGGIAVGNIIWGQISVQSDERLALILSAIGLMLGALTITKYSLMKDGDGKIYKTPFFTLAYSKYHSRIRNRKKLY
jgi:uncharacterized Tic20 family protein